MNTTARLAAHGATVVLLGAGAFATGKAVEAPTDHLTAGARTAAHGGAHQPASGAPAVAADVQPAGLSSSARGYTLVPATSTLPSGAATEFAFRIAGPDGAPVTAFDISHDKRMHLILVRTDTAYYQHLHPVMSLDGTWRTPVRLPAGGTYRAFADFVPTGGEATTLRVDLFAPGQFSPVAPKPNRTATAPGGYQVTLTGDLAPGRASDVTLTVTRNGRPVTDLQPYLGAYATSSPCAPATWVTCTCTPRAPRATGPPHRARRSHSTPRSRPPGPTGCSWTSGTEAPCAPHSSPSRQPVPRPRRRPPRHLLHRSRVRPLRQTPGTRTPEEATDDRDNSAARCTGA